MSKSTDPESAQGIKHSLHPQGWNGIFDALREGSELPELVANFGVKYRLVEQLRSTAFEGDGPASDSYYIMMKMAILYSAIEAWEKIAGKGSTASTSHEIAEQLRSSLCAPLFLMLNSVLSSEPLKQRLGALRSGESNDLIPLVEAVRHGFLHPRLTAANSTLATYPELRKLLLRVIEHSRSLLGELFSSWAEETKRSAALYQGDDDDMHEAKKLWVLAGYPRPALEKAFGQAFTEKQWSILVEEVFQEDEISVEETIAEVLGNMASFEAEYSAWEEQLAKVRSNPDHQQG